MISELECPVIVIRDPRERKSKCSLQPFRWHRDWYFINAGPQIRFDATHCIVLGMGSGELAPGDERFEPHESQAIMDSWSRLRGDCPSLRDLRMGAGRPILLLDSTWKRLPRIGKCVSGNPIQKSLPLRLRTAYPRVNMDGADPVGGLASIEAVYAAFRVLGYDHGELLAHYHWRDQFLECF